MSRSARVERATSETKIALTLDLDPERVGSQCSTGVPFFDHMLDQIARHGRMSLTVDATGDLEVDAHHTVEDVGIALGSALTDALGDNAGIRRYGDALVPMEESLAQVAVDVSGRALLVFDGDVGQETIGAYETVLTEEFLQALARSAGLTLHVRLLYGRNAHHATEAIFKALAVALGEAVAIDPRSPSEVPSTKGSL